MDPVLQVSEAEKRFGGTRALAGASFALGRGEWLGLLGPNGAGKTTLVRAVAGRVRLDGGRVVLLGEEVSPGSGRAPRRLGVVPQDVALYPSLTARENLEVFGALHGLGGAELGERVEWALGWSGLVPRAGDRVAGFSGGMKRRLNLAAGVLHAPEVVLLDEPTVGVDPQSRERIWEMLSDLRRGGTSILLTTHQLDEAQTVCERIVIVDGGRAVAEGSVDELIRETVGTERRVVLHLAEPLDGKLAGDPAGDPDGEPDGRPDGGRRLELAVDSVAGELPALLAGIGRRGGRVVDLEVHAPSLHDVFLHLTGRELRE